MQKLEGDAADRGPLPVDPSGGRPTACRRWPRWPRAARAAAGEAAARLRLERRQEDLRRAAWISALTRAAWAGLAVRRTPSGASASSIALAMAAGGEMAPPSPSPLAPSGLRGRRVLEVHALDQRQVVGARAPRSPSACPTGAGPSRRRRCPRRAPPPTPWATPPWTWPSTIIGLMTVPQSWATT